MLFYNNLQIHIKAKNKVLISVRLMFFDSFRYLFVISNLNICYLSLFFFNTSFTFVSSKNNKPMGTKTKGISKVKEPVRLRVKALSNGNQSLYLDLYYL